MSREMQKLAEVAWGESLEETILQRWLKLSQHAAGADRLIGSIGYDDFDFLLLDNRGLPVCYVEIKRRRTSFAQYGDAMFPERKHRFAQLLGEHGLPFIGVTEYGDGTLVEVDLFTTPDTFRPVTRRDRPGQSVPHVLYGKHQLTVLEGAR